MTYDQYWTGIVVARHDVCDMRLGEIVTISRYNSSREEGWWLKVGHVMQDFVYGWPYTVAAPEGAFEIDGSWPLVWLMDDQILSIEGSVFATGCNYPRAPKGRILARHRQVKERVGGIVDGLSYEKLGEENGVAIAQSGEWYDPVAQVISSGAGCEIETGQWVLVPFFAKKSSTLFLADGSRVASIVEDKIPVVFDEEPPQVKIVIEDNNA